MGTKTSATPAYYLASGIRRACARPVGNSEFYKVQDKPMSDDVKYYFARQDSANELCNYSSAPGVRENKREQIAKWSEKIAELSEQIKGIQADTSLSEDEKQKKINRRMEIIGTRKQNIAAAQIYLQHTM